MGEVVLPYAKKLRLSDPDLKVVIEFRDEGGNPAEKVYHLYSQNMAGLSNFFDTSLSVDMMERATGEIVLQDESPDVFEKAIKFQQDPRAIRSMTAYDAIELVEFYDKYEFVGGLELCDDILSEYIMQHEKGDPLKEFPQDLDLFIRAVVLSKEHNLAKTTLHGVTWLKEDFVEFAYGYLPFTTQHIRMLQPWFQEKIFDLPQGFSIEALDSPLFAELWVKCRSNYILHKVLGGVELDLSDSSRIEFNGLTAHAKWDFNDSQGDVLQKFLLKKDSDKGGWVVTASDIVLWKCPCAGDEIDYPPYGPWLPDHDTTGNVTATLRYDQ